MYIPDILAVCPPWMNNNSGGPSSASSALCSSPILLKSHTCKRRSVPDDAKIVSLCGDHCTWKISSLCDSKLCNFNFKLRRSHSATVLSALPVAKINSEYGLKLRQFTSAVCASTVCDGLLVLLHLVSHIISFWSSATEPKRLSCKRCQATSSTTAVWPVKIVFASMMRFSFGVAFMSHKQIVWSSLADSR